MYINQNIKIQLLEIYEQFLLHVFFTRPKNPSQLYRFFKNMFQGQVSDKEAILEKNLGSTSKRGTQKGVTSRLNAGEEDGGRIREALGDLRIYASGLLSYQNLFFLFLNFLFLFYLILSVSSLERERERGIASLTVCDAIIILRLDHTF